MLSNFLVKIVSAIFDLYGKGGRDSQKFVCLCFAAPTMYLSKQ